MSNLIKREDAIKELDKEYRCTDKSDDLDGLEMAIKIIEALPSAEAEDRHYIKIYADDEPSVKAEKLYQICDETQNREVAEWLKEYFPLSYDNWIPVSERLPDELAAVNITWVNHNPPPYYKYTKDVPLVDSAVYYRGKWYWWDATVIDLLGEYDGAYIHGIEPIDKDIEVVAWMPLPKPYREENEE